jgi:hypothetical protein
MCLCICSVYFYFSSFSSLSLFVGGFDSKCLGYFIQPRLVVVMLRAVRIYATFFLCCVLLICCYGVFFLFYFPFLSYLTIDGSFLVNCCGSAAGVNGVSECCDERL